MGPFQVFVSHAATDKQLVQFVASRLEAAGAMLFVASRAGVIPTGSAWMSEIVKELLARQVYLVFLTPNSIKRPWLWFEVGVAWAREFKLMPVCSAGLRKEDVPQPLASYQLLSLENADEAKQLFKEFGAELTDAEEFVKVVRELGAKVAAQASMDQRVMQEGRERFAAASDVEREVINQLLIGGEMTNRQLFERLKKKGFNVPQAGDGVANSTNLIQRSAPGREPKEHVVGYQGGFKVKPEFKEALLEITAELK